MAEADGKTGFYCPSAMDFCDNLFGYLYESKKFIGGFGLKVMNPFFIQLEAYLENTIFIFKDLFYWILNDFPLRSTDQAQARYMVKFCSLFRTRNKYHSFLIACAFILYAISTLYHRGCCRLLIMGPFCAFVLLKRQMQNAELNHINGLNFWHEKLYQELIQMSVTNSEEFKHIEATIQMHLDFPETSLLKEMNFQFVVLQDDEIKLLALRLVPTMTFEEYALQPNAEYEMCKVCKLKCFVYYIMFQKSYLTLCQ